MGGSVGTETVAAIAEVALEERPQHLRERLLDQTIQHRRYPERAFSPVRFCNEHPAHRRRAIGSFHQHGAESRPVGPKKRGKLLDRHLVEAGGSVVRFDPFPSRIQVFRVEDLLHQGSLLNPLMLPAAKALMRRRPSGPSVCHVLRGVREFLFGSALHGRSRLPVSQFKRASFSPRLARPLLRPLLTSRRLLSGGTSPGKSVLLSCATTAFTSTGKPFDFAVLCQLVALCRPSMRFLSISSQVSPSLPPAGRLPFPPWLQVVVSS